jgi:hypothetical protein
MPADAYIPIALFGALLASGLVAGVVGLIGYQAGRRAAGMGVGSDLRLRLQSRSAPQPPTDEERDCLQAAEAIARDVEVLTTLAAEPSPPSSAEMDAALGKLSANARALIGRLRGAETNNSERPSDPAAKGSAPTEAGAPSEGTSAGLAAEQAAAAGDASCPSSPSYVDRKFPRSPCAGSFKATIYPPPTRPEAAPVHCMVLTRDLSCAGVCIGHTEELFPKQIVVLHALSKLLIGEVRWCRRTGERSYIAGCHLVKASG